VLGTVKAKARSPKGGQVGQLPARDGLALWRVGDEETGFQIDEERCAALLTPVPRFTCRIGLPRASIWREVSVPMQLSMMFWTRQYGQCNCPE
jgi:hypothetical protein